MLIRYLLPVTLIFLNRPSFASEDSPSCQVNVVVAASSTEENLARVDSILKRYFETISTEREASGDLFIENHFKFPSEGIAFFSKVLLQLNSIHGVKAKCFNVEPWPRMTGSN